MSGRADHGREGGEGPWYDMFRRDDLLDAKVLWVTDALEKEGRTERERAWHSTVAPTRWNYKYGIMEINYHMETSMQLIISFTNAKQILNNAHAKLV